jgi:hypothetical protein
VFIVSVVFVNADGTEKKTVDPAEKARLKEERF